MVDYFIKVICYDDVVKVFVWVFYIFDLVVFCFFCWRLVGGVVLGEVIDKILWEIISFFVLFGDFYV